MLIHQSEMLVNDCELNNRCCVSTQKEPPKQTYNLAVIDSWLPMALLAFKSSMIYIKYGQKSGWKSCSLQSIIPWDQHAGNYETPSPFIIIPAASYKKVPNVLSPCHTKRRPGPPFFWYDTDFLDFFRFLLVWQQLGTLGTFLRDAAHHSGLLTTFCK